MKYSFLVPVYNVERFISECIDSILSNVGFDFEIILVDDGSTDESGVICDKYSSDYQNVYVFHKENEGLLSARRYAIAKAKGDYCIFVDSDDKVSCELLFNVDSILSRNEVDMVMYNAYIWDFVKPKTPVREPIFRTDKLLNCQENLYLKKCILTNDIANNMWLKCVKTSILLSDTTNYGNDLFSDYGEDLIQSLHIFDECKSIYYLNKPLYYYRMNQSSITTSFKDYSKISKLIRPGVDILRKHYAVKWGLDSEETIEMMCCARLHFLRDVFCSNYLLIKQHKMRKAYLNNNWTSLIDDSNYQYANSRFLEPIVRFELKALIEKNRFILETTRMIRAIRRLFKQ